MATVTNAGIEAQARMLAGVDAPAAFQYIALGSGTTLAEDPGNTALESEYGAFGAGRTAAACEFLAPNGARWTHTFNFFGPRALSEFGLFNTPTIRTGTMFLRHTFTPLNFVDGDSIDIIIQHLTFRV